MKHLTEKNDLCGLISIIHRKTQIYLNQALKSYGLNSAEFVYLIHIQDAGVTALRTIGAHLRMDDAQTTRVIQSLGEKGIIRKLRSQEDKRAFGVELTELGRDVKPKILKDLDEWIRLITGGIPEAEIAPLIRQLGLIAANATTLTEGK